MMRLSALLIGLAACLGMSAASATDAKLHGYTTVLPLSRAVPQPDAARAVKPLPMWSYSITASSDLGGGTYSGQVLGKSPYLAKKGSTSIKVQIVPLVITINDGTTTVVYDPTQPDSCNAGNKGIDVVAGSPIFTSDVDWTMNGVAVGKTQYIDAFQRAEFWSLVGGSNYHLKLKASVLAGQSESFSGAKNGSNLDATQYGGCGNIGVVNINDMDRRIQALITGPLAASVNAGTFPIFVTRNVVQSTSSVSLQSCCVLGYHGALTVGGNLQIYSPFSLDTSGVFGGDVNTLAHEMGEAVNDPAGTNPTPTWGNIGQVVGQCQSNFEVGDPLSEGFGTPTTPFVETGKNGLTYHLQELAFLSWFYGAPSLGAGGRFSDNGSFGGSAKLCSAGGGTN